MDIYPITRTKAADELLAGDLVPSGSLSPKVEVVIQVDFTPKTVLIHIEDVAGDITRVRRHKATKVPVKGYLTQVEMSLGLAFLIEEMKLNASSR